MNDLHFEDDINVLRTEILSLRLPADEHAEAKRQLAKAIDRLALHNPKYAAMLRQEELP